MMRLRIVALGATGLACVLVSPAYSQSTNPQGTTSIGPAAEIETVTVTARRRAEDLEKVPLNVTVISGDLLRSQEIKTATDLQTVAPTLTVTGTIAADGKSLTGATYNVSGGTCAFTGPADAEGQSFSSVTGNYAGSFSDPYGNLIDITATLTQTPDSDTDGNFQLSGTGTFPTNPCFISPVSVASSQVTGSFSRTSVATGSLKRMLSPRSPLRTPPSHSA